MNDQNNAAQAAQNAIEWATTPGAVENFPATARAHINGLASLLLSMLRAPVAGEAVSWQVRRTDGSPLACWETCTKELYDLTKSTGRYSGFENGPPCEVRALGVIDAAPQASAEYERGHADGWAAAWDQAQAYKDGGRRRGVIFLAYGTSMPVRYGASNRIGTRHDMPSSGNWRVSPYSAAWLLVIRSMSFRVSSRASKRSQKPIPSPTCCNDAYRLRLTPM